MSALCISALAYSQVVVSGISPAAIQGNYDFGTQAACGAWPGETDDGTWGVWPGIDFNVAGTFIQAELELVEDGTPGINPQGNPISQEGCNGPLTNSVADGNDLTGKIAVVYRNTCWFSAKVFYAQEAGAVAVIVVNREDAIMGMLGNTDPLNGPLGADCTIPAVIISSIDGANIVAEMANGPVEMFIGNKLGAFANDAGAVKGEFLVNDFGGSHNAVYDGMTPGIQVYNYGSADQATVNITASIDGPAGNVYSETVGPLNILSGDTAAIFPGNPIGEFTPWALGVGNYTDGNYTLTYTIDLGGTTDEFAFDNVYTSDFSIQGDVISLSRLDASNMPIANSFPSNSTTEYSSCMMFQEANASNLGVQGVYFVPHGDTVTDLPGAEIFVNAYQWDDAWTDLNDPAFTFDPATQDGFQSLNLITFADYFPASESEQDQVAYAAFPTPFLLQDNVRYLFCLQTFESATISFGYDNAIDYGANYSIFAQPMSPVMVDGSTYAAGWNGVSAASIGLRTFDPSELGLESTKMLNGSAYPNPATDVVTVAIDANGPATISVTDVAGKVAFNNAITLVNGKTTVDISSLETGVYIFNVTLENGETSQFNVVKK